MDAIKNYYLIKSNLRSLTNLIGPGIRTKSLDRKTYRIAISDLYKIFKLVNEECEATTSLSFDGGYYYCPTIRDEISAQLGYITKLDKEKTRKRFYTRLTPLYNYLIKLNVALDRFEAKQLGVYQIVGQIPELKYPDGWNDPDCENTSDNLDILRTILNKINKSLSVAYFQCTQYNVRNVIITTSIVKLGCLIQQFDSTIEAMDDEYFYTHYKPTYARQRIKICVVKEYVPYLIQILKDIKSTYSKIQKEANKHKS